MNQPLARLERVDLRTTWQSEPGAFTPWLAEEENIALLGEPLGLELEVEAQERDVGPFRADILCKDTATGSWVLIENQLERTDHTHLGQLLTYAAGLEAVTIVWIAASFTEEHRATLDWLNEITDERFTFFGLEVELWSIAGSPPAPKFNVVSKPNDWTKQVSRGVKGIEAGLTPTARLRLEYWTAFRQSLLDSRSFLRPRKPQSGPWMDIALGRSGFHLAAIASTWDAEAQSYDGGELCAEVQMTSPNAKAHFAALEARRDAIEQAVGESLTWYNPPEARKAKVYIRRSANLQDRADWPEQHAWLRTKLETLHRTFSPLVRQLDMAPEAGETAAEADLALGSRGSR